MNELKEKVQIIMLPTGYSKLYLTTSKLVVSDIPLSKIRGMQPYDIYITSGRKIADGYVYNTLAKEVQRFQSSTPVISQYIQRVEASTDTSLLVPQPSPQFIAKYVELYNAGTPITEAEMEMSYRGQLYDERNTTNSYHPKLDKSNYITLRKVEEDWDDINNKYDQYRQICVNDRNTAQSFYNWLQENYNPPTKKK